MDNISEVNMDNNDVTPVKTVYSVFVKRVLDILLSGIAIIVLSPLLFVVALLELKYHGRPIVYCTKRPGKDAKIFKMYKFRSMTNEVGEDGWLLPEEDRLTRFGKFIRKTSLDELTELFNILKGDMSIIGPRPLLVEYLDYYSPKHSMRHAVRPGLACFRIIPTDSTTWTWGEQFDNDIWYVEHVSFITDAKMVFAVIKEVFKASDVRANDTRPPFTGDNLNDTRSKNEVGETRRFDSVGRIEK